MDEGKKKRGNGWRFYERKILKGDVGILKWKERMRKGRIRIFL